MKRIMFGFYKGLGDFISDSYIIREFSKGGYRTTVFVSNWLYEIAKYILPTVDVKKYSSSKDLLREHYDYDYIFLTPNYLHPFTLEKRALWLYLLKLFIVKIKSKESVVIHPSYRELFYHYFQLKGTFLDEHFFFMSEKLIRKFFPYIHFKNPDWSYKGKPFINRVLIFPFSGNENKDYPVEKYALVAENLKNLGVNEVLFFVQSKDRKKLNFLEGRFPVETKSLVGLAKTFKSTDLVISGDTGPAHLGGYFGANLLVLYGYTKPEKYRPISSGKVITLQSKTGLLKDISHLEILALIKKNFSFKGREKNDEQKAVNMYSNV